MFNIPYATNYIPSLISPLLPGTTAAQASPEPILVILHLQRLHLHLLLPLHPLVQPLFICCILDKSLSPQHGHLAECLFVVLVSQDTEGGRVGEGDWIDGEDMT